MRTAMICVLVLILAAAAVLYFAGRSSRVVPVQTNPSGGLANPKPELSSNPPPEASQPKPEEAKDMPTPSMPGNSGLSPAAPSAPTNSGTALAPPPSPEAQSEGVSSKWTDVEKKVLELTNVKRSHAGLPPLEADDGLHTSARFQSSDMIARQFFDHVNPSGENPSDRIGRLHRRLVGTAGENIWEGTGSSFVSDPNLAVAIVKAWMASPHHRENILRAEFTHMGVGVVIEGSDVRATQNFSHERASLTADLPEAVSSGTHMKLQTSGAGGPATMYALQKEGSSAKNSPLPIEGNVVTAPPGKYRVQFYFPEKDGFLIVNGPQLTVR